MTSPSKDPSAEHEPHLRPGPFEPDPGEARADKALARARKADRTDDARVEQSVWDEPALSAELAGRPGSADLTYANWLARKRAETSPGKTWRVTLLVALAAGPWAVLGALWGSGQTAFGLLLVVVFAPVVEETMKAAAALYVVEKRPHLFSRPIQIVICTAAGGLVFAVIENLIYLNVYVPAPPRWLVWWRWTVCVALHVTCSLGVGLGLRTVWRRTWRDLERPRLERAGPWWLAAAILHGLYNGLAVGYGLIVRS